MSEAVPQDDEFSARVEAARVASDAAPLLPSGGPNLSAFRPLVEELAAAVTAPRAADLPIGSVVLQKSPRGPWDSSAKTWTAVEPMTRGGHEVRWSSDTGWAADDRINELLTGGAQVLRVGDGSEQ